MTPTAQAHSRREADRKAYLDESRIAQAMRADARSFRETAAELDADPNIYGPAARDYLDGVRARFEVVATWCDYQADLHGEYAQQYLELVTEAHALGQS